MKKKNIIITAAAVAVVAALVLPRFLKPKDSVNSAAAPVVSAEQPQIGTIEIYTDLSGSIEPSEMASIIPKAGGEVTEVYVKAGDMVTEGQPICHIDTKMVDTAKNSMETAAVNMENANKELERSRVLFESGNMSQQAFEQVQSSARMAQLQYDSAKIAYDNQVEFSSITAPISGKVESVSVEVHDNVGTQNIICVISGEGAKQVNFSVTERVVAGLHVGDTVIINKNGTDYEGTISEVSTKIDDATGLFNEIPFRKMFFFYIQSQFKHLHSFQSIPSQISSGSRMPRRQAVIFDSNKLDSHALHLFTPAFNLLCLFCNTPRF